MNKEVFIVIERTNMVREYRILFYLKLSKLFSENNYFGISNFFLEQSNEEREHMIKIFTYVLEQEGEPIVPSYNFLDDEEYEFNITELFECSLENERKVTNSINKIISKCKGGR